MLRLVDAGEVLRSRREPLDPGTLADARRIVEDVRDGGESALRAYAERFDGLEPGGALVLGRDALDAALSALDPEVRGVLERTGDRVRGFATAQRASLRNLEVGVVGGRAGHTVVPMEVGGCYAPGGRYPLPSSVLMTVIPARVAGVGTVVLATPSREPVMLAAAAVAGADMVLGVGGAHAIGAMAYGVGVPACDIVVGPGNRWVTAAKHVVSARCAIDMLAGPSELLIIADGTADPAVVAADLLAQAEHDADACPQLVTTDPSLVERVNAEIGEQLRGLPTADVARDAVAVNGWACVVGSIDEAIAVADRVAPEHLEILTEDPEWVGARVRHAGAVFVGTNSAEVMGDYGLGPNHTLPTGRTARSRGGLSVLDFLRVRTWMRLDEADPRMCADAAAMARIERLEAHARSVECRLAGRSVSRRGSGRDDGCGVTAG